MSAIAGVVRLDGGDIDDATLTRIVAETPRRGADGVSVWHAGPAGLVRFHHAATPEAVGEVQPVIGRESGLVMVFDGRLDNRPELLALLGERGGPLAAAPDAAIGLALFERLGEPFLEVLVGDWTLAIWDPRQRRLFCARSPCGWRPFLWTLDRGRFAFATEPRGLMLGLQRERRLNEGAIAEYLANRFVTQTDTFWEGIERLPQGAAILVEKGAVRRWHWDTRPFEETTRLSEGEHVERFLELFDQALVACTRSQTPVTSHLSGGLDSSSILCRATELHRAGKIDHQLRAISARFPGEQLDESQWSMAVEAHLGITAEVTGREPYDLDRATAWCASTYQLPIRASLFDGIRASYRLMEADGRRVLLTGQGGDEWLSGGFAHFPDLLRRGQLIQLFREAISELPDLPIHRRLRRSALLAAGPLVSQHYRQKFVRPHLNPGDAVPAWLRGDWCARVALAGRERRGALPVDPPGYAQKQRYSLYAMARRHVGTENTIAAAESFGVELRHPFYDQRLARFCMGVPGHMLRRNGEKKYLLRQAMRGTLPEIVRTRQSKAVFIKGHIDIVDDFLRRTPPESLLLAQFGWIEPAAIEPMFAPSRAWRDAGATGPLDRTKLGPLWAILATELWLRGAAGL